MLIMGKQKETSIIFNFINSLAKYADDGKAKKKTSITVNYINSLAKYADNTEEK